MEAVPNETSRNELICCPDELPQDRFVRLGGLRSAPSHSKKKGMIPILQRIFGDCRALTARWQSFGFLFFCIRPKKAFAANLLSSLVGSLPVPTRDSVRPICPGRIPAHAKVFVRTSPPTRSNGPGDGLG